MNKMIIAKIATIFVFLLLLVIGCSNETSDGSPENKAENQETENESHSSEEKKIGKQKEGLDESYKTDLGNPHIWFGGEVTVKEETIVVKGESNLLENANLRVVLFDYLVPGTSIPIIGDSSRSTRTQSDGSFQIEFQKPSNYKKAELAILFQPGIQPQEHTQHYGFDLENIEGPFVFLGTHGTTYQAKATLLLDLEELGVYPIEKPIKYEIPDDYGHPNVWMETDVTNDHYFYYVHIKSNLIEGSVVRGRFFHPDGRHLFTTIDAKHVRPDGSVDLRIRYYDIIEDMFLLIEMIPNSADWANVREVYGDNGEKLQGDLVQKNDNGTQQIAKKIELDLPDFRSPDDVDMTSADDEIKLQIPDKVLFGFDESKLKTEARKTLNDIIEQLEKLESGTVIHINGHTDNQGNADYNQGLSEKRAQSVYDYLINNGKIEHLNIETKGYGQTKPIASNDNEEGRSKNRRVEIVINPN